MFIKRFFSAVVLLTLAASALVFGGPYLLGISAIAALFGTYELLKLENIQKSVPGCITYVSVAGFYLFLFFDREDLFSFWIVLVVLATLACYVLLYPKFHIKSIALCLFSVVYVGILVSYIYQTRCIDHGIWFVWLILIGASGSDTFAYLTGVCIGKHHFSELSPKKTIEGCVGGVVGTTILMVIYSFMIPDQVALVFGIDIHFLFACIGIISSIFSQIGDLAASAIKRNYGIKDFSNLIPGHGGILDRLDSMLFVSPLVYYLLYLFMA